MNTRYFARYWYPGFLFSEDSYIEIPEPNIEYCVEHASENAYAFQIYSQKWHIEDGIEYKADMVLVQDYVFLSGVLMDYDDVAREVGESSIAARNMKYNDISFVVKTKVGQLIPFYKDSIIVEPKAHR